MDNLKKRLKLLRKTGEGFKIVDNHGDIKVTICKVEGNRIKFAIKAPGSVDIHLYESYKRNNADLQQKVESYYYQTTKKNEHSYSAQPCVNKNNLLNKKKILLVEDSPIIRMVNSEFLKTLGYFVDSASDGRSAFDLMHNTYDLILLDIGLPDITGINICKRVRKSAANVNKDTPIIFLTAYGEIMRDKCNAVGANDFAVKPLSIERLGKLVDRWV